MRGSLVLGGLLVCVLAGPAVAWSWHLLDLLANCADGYGNRDVAGELTASACHLSSAGTPVFRLPWHEDLIIAVALVASAVAVVVVVLGLAGGHPARRWLTALPVPALLVAGLLMGRRAWGERALERMNSMFTLPADLPAPESYVAGPHPGGWRLHTPTTDILLPEPDPVWFLVALAAGLLALGFGWRAVR